jgi:hypothetical protein
MARPCGYTTAKVEEWRSIDLADLRRWRMLDPTTIARTGKIPAITWETPNGIDKLGVIAPRLAACCSSDAMIRVNSARCRSVQFLPDAVRRLARMVPMPGMSAGLPCPLRRYQPALP